MSYITCDNCLKPVGRGLCLKCAHERVAEHVNPLVKQRDELREAMETAVAVSAAQEVAQQAQRKVRNRHWREHFTRTGPRYLIDIWREKHQDTYHWQALLFNSYPSTSVQGEALTSADAMTAAEQAVIDKLGRVYLEESDDEKTDESK